MSSKESMWFCVYCLKYLHMLCYVASFHIYSRIQFKNSALEFFARHFSKEVENAVENGKVELDRPAFKIRLVILGHVLCLIWALVFSMGRFRWFLQMICKCPCKYDIP